jgi:demethylmenaquinone methyltransferase/2-methoxy-6-polyprenyl-1,4-benzoquinol methylase
MVHMPVNRKKSPEPWSSEELKNPHGREDKAQKVQAMFNAIAGRYDLANTVISFGQAGGWRKTLVRMIRDRGGRTERILDLCCGTGDMMKLMAEEFPSAKIYGADFAVKMLQRIKSEFPCLGADALEMPFSDQTFDLVTCAFGLRNYQNLETGLQEIHRVLRPGGVLGVLEFQPPGGRWGGFFFNLYFNRILPILGALVTGGGRTRAYEYLPRSVSSWYGGNFLIELMRKNGFQEIQVRKLCFGAVWALTAKKGDSINEA